jgi:tetratricopeptide (TPR) repeat protein
MNPEFQLIVQQAAAGQSQSFKDVSRFSPSDIRLGIQWLMSEEQNDLAQALADAGIALYPLSEDILAMGGLLAMTRQDWSLAIELLSDLREVQQDRTQPMTYRMLARALYCNLDPAEAIQVVEQGLAFWPEYADLLQEREVMGEHLMAMPATGLHS